MTIEKLNDWILRMECDRFIMIINKNTGKYKNLYSNDFTNKEEIKNIASSLERHKLID